MSGKSRPMLKAQSCKNYTVREIFISYFEMFGYKILYFDNTVLHHNNLLRAGDILKKISSNYWFVLRFRYIKINVKLDEYNHV